MRELWGAVDRLSPQQRAALLLHVQEEQSTSEIAAVLQCSEADGAGPPAPGGERAAQDDRQG